MKGFAMLKIGATGWIEKEIPKCGPMDAICKPLALAPCTSDIHTVWAGAIGERSNMILGHEAVGEVVEVGTLVRDFKVGDKVLVSAITPDWNSRQAQEGFAMHSGGMLSGWKFSNFKDGVFAEYFHVNDADGNLAHLPEGMDLAAAAMISDMVPTGFHGAELADIQFGDNVAVIGIGHRWCGHRDLHPAEHIIKPLYPLHAISRFLHREVQRNSQEHLLWCFHWFSVSCMDHITFQKQLQSCVCKQPIPFRTDHISSHLQFFFRICL